MVFNWKISRLWFLLYLHVIFLQCIDGQSAFRILLPVSFFPLKSHSSPLLAASESSEEGQGMARQGKPQRKVREPPTPFFLRTWGHKYHQSSSLDTGEQFVSCKFESLEQAWDVPTTISSYMHRDGGGDWERCCGCRYDTFVVNDRVLKALSLSLLFYVHT